MSASFSRLGLAALLLLPAFAARASEQASGELVVPPVQAAKVPPNADAGLSADPALRRGTLPNGLRYAVLPNAQPKGRASLRLLVDAGAFEETPAQRGLAHFLEHMAFNGSTHFPPGSLVEYFQRMGMSFGGDTNATTSFDKTQYMQELAQADEKTLGQGLQVLADFAGGLLLLDSEIDKERGVILSEMRARDSASLRTSRARLAFEYPKTLLPEHFPIGETEIIRTAKRESFVDFYDAWYRPERMFVVVVGDFEPELVERLISQTFGSLTARAPARQYTDFGVIDTTPGLRVGFHFEPETTGTQIILSSSRAEKTRSDTLEHRLRELKVRMAVEIVNRRLIALSKLEGACFSSSKVSISTNYRRIRQAMLSVGARSSQWEAATAVVEQELRRALEHGFLEWELEEVRATLLNAMHQAAKSASTRRSPQLANELAASLIDEHVFTSPEQDLAVLEPELLRFDVSDCIEVFRQEWAQPVRSLFVTGNLRFPLERGREVLLAAYQKSQEVAVSAPVEQRAQSWAYTDFGVPGRVVSRERAEDLGISMLRFENGVRLNLKHTDFEAGRVQVLVRLGSGGKAVAVDKPGLGHVADAFFDLGGLGKHSSEDLRHVLSGHSVSANFSTTQDSFRFTGTSSSEDLLLELQLLSAKISDPGFRPSALRLGRIKIEQTFAGFEHSSSGAISRKVLPLLASGDPRFGVRDRRQLLSYTQADVKEWLLPELEKGPLEISLVGDFDEKAAVSAVASTLGTLPLRSPTPLRKASLEVKYPALPLRGQFTFKSAIPKGTVALYWPATDGLDHHVARRLGLLVAVLKDRLRAKVREEMGETYSPRAGLTASAVYPGYGYMSVVVDVSPSAAGKVADAVVALADDLARNGVGADELERARQPFLTGLRDSERTNSYWLNVVLAQVQERPELLTWARDRQSDVLAITKAELDALAARFLGADRVSRFVIVPELAAGNAGR